MHLSKFGITSSRSDPGPVASAAQQRFGELGTPKAPAAIGAAIAQLAIAREYARDLGCDRWQFAIEISHLTDLGVTHSDLRWLLEKGYVIHAREVTELGDPVRKFSSYSNTAFFSDTRFLLTDAGLSVADGDDSVPMLLRFPQCYAPAEAAAANRPRWDADDGTLYFGQRIVKRFKRPAPNQAIILATFEEESWPGRIDDPLSPARGIDAKRRLHDTIKWLNRNVEWPLMHFSGDGTGEGVRWHRFDSGAQPVTPETRNQLRAAA